VVTQEYPVPRPAVRPFQDIVSLGDFLMADITGFTETELVRAHVTVARHLRDEVISDQGEPSEETILVDGRPAASEEGVKPFGVIAYRWQYWREIVEWALKELQDRSPVDSGEYRAGWFVMVNGDRVAPDRIPIGARQVIITNDRPYHRKVEVGAMRMRVPPHIIEAVRQEIFKGRFGNAVRPSIRFITIPNGYILEGRQRSAAKKYAAWIKAGRKKTVNLAALSPLQNRRSKAFREGRSTLVSRADTRKGQPLTYPALVLEAL